MKYKPIKGGLQEMRSQSDIKRKLKTLTVSERKRYGVPTTDGGIDLLTGAVLLSMFSNISESHDAPSHFSGGGGDFGGGGASGSWDSDSSSSSSSYDSGSSGGCDCGGGCGGGD